MERIKNHRKDKQHVQQNSSVDQRLMLSKNAKSLQEEVKLAGIAVSLNICLRAADMPFTMQERALGYTRYLLRCSNPTNHRASPTILARALKKEFDSSYGPAWHCVVGKSFGSFVTHSPGGFLYFSIDSLSFLLFKTEVQLVKQPSRH